MSNTHRLMLAALIFALSMAALGNQSWHFDVYLDGDRIGQHRFELNQAGPLTTVQTHAAFSVRFLMFEAYHYEHTNTEQWNGQCLQRIDAVTNDNGDYLLVKGEQKTDQFVVETHGQSKTLQNCIRSFAYWDLERLRAQRLLNAQTGDYVAVELVSLGEDRLELGQRRIDAQRYRLQGKDLQIDLWYSSQDEWLGLETVTEDGRRLRYRIQHD